LFPRLLVPVSVCLPPVECSPMWISVGITAHRGEKIYPTASPKLPFKRKCNVRVVLATPKL
jgi:hypothetical protein